MGNDIGDVPVSLYYGIVIDLSLNRSINRLIDYSDFIHELTPSCNRTPCVTNICSVGSGSVLVARRWSVPKTDCSSDGCSGSVAWQLGHVGPCSTVRRHQLCRTRAVETRPVPGRQLARRRSFKVGTNPDSFCK